MKVVQVILFVKKFDIRFILFYLCQKIRHMKEWLEKHDAISLHWIEKKIGLKTGSLHKGREIPTRYLEAIEKVLIEYGYKVLREEESLNVGAETKPTGKVYEVTKATVIQYYDSTTPGGTRVFKKEELKLGKEFTLGFID